MRSMKILLSVLTVLSLAPAVWLPHRVRAATCTGISCNGLDPVTTGCSVDAYIVSSAPIIATSTGTGQIGTVYYKWSPTCQAGYGTTETMGGPAASIVAHIWGGQGSGSGRIGRNTNTVNSTLIGAGSYCDLFASGVITMTTGGTTGGAGTPKSCP